MVDVFELCVNDTYGRCLKPGDYVKIPNSINREMHGENSYYKIIIQGGFPVLTYLMSDTGHPIPPDYIKTFLSDYYTPKTLLWASPEYRPEPKDSDITRLEPGDLPHEIIDADAWSRLTRAKTRTRIAVAKSRKRVQQIKIMTGAKIYVAFTKGEYGELVNYGFGVSESAAVDDMLERNPEHGGNVHVVYCKAVSDVSMWPKALVYYQDEQFGFVDVDAERVAGAES